MKRLLVAGLLAVVPIAISETTVHAQSAPRSFPSTESQSTPLVTQPASVNRPTIGNRQSPKPYTAEQLNSALGTIEARPRTQTPTQANSIESLIQKLKPSSSQPTAVDPIDFFKPPALNGGVKVPLQ